MRANMRPAWPQGSGATPNRSLRSIRNGFTNLRQSYLSRWGFLRRHL